MRNPKNHVMHQAAPKEYRHTPDMTGSYELDSVIRKNANKNLPSRLKMFLDKSDLAYGPLTGYSGYHNYSGDS